MAGRRTKIAVGVVLITCAAAVALYFYMVGEVACPYCSTLSGAGFPDLEGKRVMWIKYWDDMTDEERSAFTGHPGVFMTEHCPYCGRSGRMRRIDIFMGKRPDSEEPLS